MPRVFYSDAELLQLLDARPELWDDLCAAGTPLRDPNSNRVTFLATASAHSMHLWINRLTDKQRHNHGVMQQVPGRPWWVRTLDIPPALIASYCFRPDAGQHRPPGHNRFPFLRDQTSAHQLIVDSEYGLSLLLGKNAQVHPAWRGIDFTRPRRSHAYRSSGYELWLYVPAVPFRNLPVVVLFDADVFFCRLQLEQALDKAITAGDLPPLAVLGLGFTDSDHRHHCLTNPVELAALIDSVLYPQAVALAHQRGHILSTDIILAGQSLGGLAALRIGCANGTQTSLFSRSQLRGVIAASPSLWWHPVSRATPADRAQQITPWFITQLQKTIGDFPPAFIDVGIREDESVAQALYLSATMTEQQWPHDLAFYDGGHDFACWRETLLRRLPQALKQLPLATVKEPQ